MLKTYWLAPWGPDMNVILFILFALYVCWTLSIVVSVAIIKLNKQQLYWDAYSCSMWCMSTTAVILYFWFNY